METGCYYCGATLTGIMIAWSFDIEHAEIEFAEMTCCDIQEVVRHD